ncbi:glycosyltransferase family 4 protein [Thiorhodospira sibirica]|uniref:glycosyltransferase family 4 protein n=1 Tax=Thiorhodospira sibirica TaxID=154347 RepID=UPI00022C0BA4|nr:glycosyltransferase family 4 protein [Thiorhodospira sibirica]
MTHPASFIYLSRSRLHRNRANLFQTLKTAHALHQAGVPLSVWLPPWHRLDVKARLRDIGIRSTVPLVRRQLLHRRWPVGLFARVYRHRLAQADTLYTRDAWLAYTLCQHGLRCHLEVHEVAPLHASGLLADVIALHRAGRIASLLPISQAAFNLLAHAGAESTRMYVVPSAADIEAFAQIMPLQPEHLQRPVGIYAGTITHSRGLGILQAIADSGHCEVLLVGTLKHPLQARSGLHLQGFVPPADIPALYGRAGLALMPYQPDLRHAGVISPLKIYEAMAAGRAVLASDLPAIREIIRHGENGFLLPPDQPGAWIAQIQQLQQQPELALMVAQRARQAAQQHSWQHRAERLVQILGIVRDPIAAEKDALAERIGLINPPPQPAPAASNLR